MNNCAVLVSNLSVTLPNGVKVLDEINFKLPSGSVCALVGPNGAGKSTLLRALLGLEKRAIGSCQLLGSPFAAGHTKVAYVPQSADVDWDFPATVGDVVGMGLAHESHPLLQFTQKSRSAKRNKILHYLKQVGIESCIDRPLAHLSGGQRKRTFFARALAQNPDLFLLDEPFAGVDYETEMALTQQLKLLAKSGRTSLLVHHDVTSIERIFEHVVLLNVKLFASGKVTDVWSKQVLSDAFQASALRPHAK
jgi:manganese/zinc/iron transport system ATP- binding protein